MTNLSENMSVACTIILGHLQRVINVRHGQEVHKGINSEPQLIPCFLLDFLRFAQTFQKERKNQKNQVLQKILW